MRLARRGLIGFESNDTRPVPLRQGLRRTRRTQPVNFRFACALG